MMRGADATAQVFIGAAMGGTAEALGGGSFANGAITWAYVVLFNHLNHSPQNLGATRSVNKAQRNRIKGLINDISFYERVRNANDEVVEGDAEGYNENINVDVNVDGISNSPFYENKAINVGNMDITIGNKVLSVGVTYIPSNIYERNFVKYVTHPNYDVQYRYQFQNAKSATLIELNFKSQEDYNSYNSFVNGNKKW